MGLAARKSAFLSLLLRAVPAKALSPASGWKTDAGLVVLQDQNTRWSFSERCVCVCVCVCVRACVRVRACVESANQQNTWPHRDTIKQRNPTCLVYTKPRYLQEVLSARTPLESWAWLVFLAATILDRARCSVPVHLPVDRKDRPGLRCHCGGMRQCVGGRWCVWRVDGGVCGVWTVVCVTCGRWCV